MTDTTTPIPGYKMALAGSMAGGIAGFLGNPAELIMVRMQADKAKPEGRKYLAFQGLLSPDDRTVQLQEFNSRISANDEGGRDFFMGEGDCSEYSKSDIDEHVTTRLVSFISCILPHLS